MAANITVFLLAGREGPGPVERWVAAGRAAAARDALDLLLAHPRVGRVVVAAPPGELAAELAGLPVTWDWDDPAEPFHFGRRLAGLLESHPADACFYTGAGSLPLLPAASLAEALEAVASAPSPLAVTNNLHSSDWLAFNCPPAVFARPERLPSDNALGWVLKVEAGVEVRSLPPGASTRLDIDTPTDLLLLALHPNTGGHLRRFLAGQGLGPEWGAVGQAAAAGQQRWLAVARRLFAPGGQVALIGRVAAGVWAYLGTRTQSWIRVFSEERGMSASGRLAAGKVRSLVGAHLDRLGPEAFFAELAGMVEAVVFDTRAVLAQARRWPPAADRYASDLGLPGQVADEYLHALTAAAVAAPIPVVLGGHGAVAGDLYALADLADLAARDPEVAA